MTGFDVRVGAAAAADGSDPISTGARRITTIFGSGQAGAGLVPAVLLLQSAGSDGEGENLRVTIADADGAEIAVLGPFSDEDAVALWRSLAAVTGLQPIIAGQDGQLYSACAQIGRLQLGPVRMRRRFAPLSGRRPRFLIRRKSGHMPRRPLVYRGREIAARQDGR